MTILKWSAASGYAGYLGVTDEDERKLNWYNSIMGDPLPSISDWTPPRLAQYLGDGKKKRKPAKIGDAPRSGKLALISDKARNLLSDMWARDALLYPVWLEDASEPFYMVVAKHTIDCLVREKSTGKRQKYGPTPDLFAVLEEWEFDEAALGIHDLFVLPDSPSTIYVTERFKQQVVDAGLKGFCLKQSFWEEKSFIS